MARILHRSGTFFLILAAFILNAHMIIPHDHHQADSNALQEERCPASDNNSGHHSRFPVHCHAFNDLTSEKILNFITLKHLQCIYSIPCCSLDNEVYDTEFCSTRIWDRINRPVNSGILLLSSLRAPPARG
jgi:hypothetical protein